jgi:hypothetical protein
MSILVHMFVFVDIVYISPYLCICPYLLICLYLQILFISVNMHHTQFHRVRSLSRHAPSVYISLISRLYTFKSCLNLFICLYSARLGVNFFLYKQNINKICTDVNDMNRYEQICVCPYMLIFLQFI